MMRSSVPALLVLAAVAVCGWSAWALPPDQIVTYKARETPSNLNGDVLLLHRLHISAVFQAGDDISWRIDKLTFDEPGGGDWTEHSPGLDYWLVTHADPDKPVASDFGNPPTMSGTADNDASGDDLVYSLVNGSCSIPEGAMYGGDVACNTYKYEAGTTTIAEEDEDEPEEIDFVNDPI